MANTKTIFLGTKESGTHETELKCYRNYLDEIFIEIKMEGFEPEFICLDRSTAIRLVKVLKSEIAQIDTEK